MLFCSPCNIKVPFHRSGMSPVDVKCTWPLHRLASMLKDAHSKAKESWKESPLSPVTSMVIFWIANM